MRRRRAYRGLPKKRGRYGSLWRGECGGFGSCAAEYHNLFLVRGDLTFGTRQRGIDHRRLERNRRRRWRRRGRGWRLLRRYRGFVARHAPPGEVESDGEAD